jgi:hypothetical protein
VLIDLQEACERGLLTAQDRRHATVTFWSGKSEFKSRKIVMSHRERVRNRVALINGRLSRHPQQALSQHALVRTVVEVVAGHDCERIDRIDQARVLLACALHSMGVTRHRQVHILRCAGAQHVSGDAGFSGTFGNVFGTLEEDDGQRPLYGIDRLGGFRTQLPGPPLNAVHMVPVSCRKLGECPLLVPGESRLVCIGGGCAEEGGICVPLMLSTDGVYGPTAGSTCLKKPGGVGSRRSQ